VYLLSLEATLRWLDAVDLAAHAANNPTQLAFLALGLVRRGQSVDQRVYFGEGLQASTLRPNASSAQNNIAAVSANGSTACVLIRRLNSSCGRSIAFVVLALRHWLDGLDQGS
jgi:hypothetical protein